MKSRVARGVQARGLGDDFRIPNRFYLWLICFVLYGNDMKRIPVNQIKKLLPVYASDLAQLGIQRRFLLMKFLTKK